MATAATRQRTAAAAAAKEAAAAAAALASETKEQKSERMNAERETAKREAAAAAIAAEVKAAEAAAAVAALGTIDVSAITAEAKKTAALAGTKPIRSDEAKAAREKIMERSMPFYVISEDTSAGTVTLSMPQPLTLAVYSATGNSGIKRYYCNLPDTDTSFEWSFNNSMSDDRVQTIQYAYRSIMYRQFTAIIGEKPETAAVVKAKLSGELTLEKSRTALMYVALAMPSDFNAEHLALIQSSDAALIEQLRKTTPEAATRIDAAIAALGTPAPEATAAPEAATVVTTV